MLCVCVCVCVQTHVGVHLGASVYENGRAKESNDFWQGCFRTTKYIFKVMSACIDKVEYLRKNIDTSKVGNAVDTEVNEFYFDGISIPHSKRQ